jgi:maltose alpha-D-glucosyltransferase / alpha-amylase
MQWSADRNAGFSRANPQRLYLPVVIDPPYAYESLNVETERDDTHSLFWWVRRMIALRKQHKAFGRGTLEVLYPSNRKVLAFIRAFEDERILVVANLSRHVQYVELDLSAYRGMVPVEMTGQTEFPAIGALTYLLTLGPHASYWFHLTAPDESALDQHTATALKPWPRLAVKHRWDQVFRGRSRTSLEGVLPTFLRSRRWFGGKARRVTGASIADVIPLPQEAPTACVLLVTVEYAEGDPETYLITCTHASGDEARQVRDEQPRAVICELAVDGEDGVLYGATSSKAFGQQLLQAIGRKRRFKGEGGELVASPTRAFRRLAGSHYGDLEVTRMGAEQSNTSLRFDQQLMLKLFRRLEEGTNPDIEITGMLTEAGFPHVPQVAGSLEYVPHKGEPISIGILQSFVPNEGDAWEFTLDSLGRYFERVLSLTPDQADTATLPVPGLLEAAQGAAHPLALDLMGTYLESARLLGERTAELHLALTASREPAFAPEPFTPFYQRSLYQSMRNLTEEVFDLLGKRLAHLPEGIRDDAARVFEKKAAVLRRFRAVTSQRISIKRTRHHGDFHLGQVLWTGRDFVILDFEGEPARQLSTRRIKRSALRDVAGMIRSFDYAAHTAMATVVAGGLSLPESAPSLQAWAAFWRTWASSAFLRSYLRAAGRSVVVPRDPSELDALLSIYLLEKVVYELGYELNNRPDWVWLPLHGIERALDAAE